MFLSKEGVLGTTPGTTWRPWGDLGLRAGVLGSSWATLGGSRAAPGASWGPPGALLGSPGALLGSPGPRLGRPGGVWEGQGAPQEVPGTPPGGTFGPGWRHPRLPKKHLNSSGFCMFLSEEGALGTTLGITWRPWGDLGLRAGVLGSSWEALGASRATPGVSWGRPGPPWGDSGLPDSVPGRSRSPGEPPDPECRLGSAECAKPLVLVLDSFR